VIAVDLGTGLEAPSRIGSITLNSAEGYLRSATLHPEGSRAWFTGSDSPGKLIRVGMGQSGTIQGCRITLSENAALTKMHFYSHEAAGSLRLAIYDTDASPNLLWQSPSVENTVEEDWLTLPVEEGFPSSPALPAGDYWLAFQVDHPGAVPSWSEGSAGSAFSVVHSFGDFPEALISNTPTAIELNDSKWSLYLSYDNHMDAPSDPELLENTEHSLTWGWKDNTTNESGFKVWADPGVAIPITLRETLPPDSVSWMLDTLTPNCLYSFQVAATLFADSDRTSNLSSYTLAAAAEPGVSLDAAIGPDTPCLGGTEFHFSNPAGFGTSSHGVSPYKISAYRYRWNTVETHTFTGSESLWDSGTLTMESATVSQSYYLHLQSMNAAGRGGGTFSYGPFVIDADPPAAPVVNGPPLTKEQRPQWTWQSGGGGMGLYAVELNDSGNWIETESLSFIPDEDLPEGGHTLRVRERDEVGNWSEPGSCTITIDFSPFSAVIQPLNPLETGASTLSFRVVFAQTPASDFTADFVTPTGSLTGDISVSGSGTEYVVTLQLHDPDTDGETGISIAGGQITDIYGNEYGGGVSPIISIRKWHSPYFLSQPENARKYSGESHLFQVVPHSAASTMSYQWKAERADKSIIAGPTTSRWILDSLLLSEAGTYWCELSYDGVTRSTQAVVLELREALKLTSHPQGGKIRLGGSHRFLATVIGGYPPLHYAWYKDGVQQTLLPEVPDITLSDLSPEDSGMYHLVVSDSNGSAIKTPAVYLEVSESALPVYGTVTAGLLGLFVLATGLHLVRQRERS
jgi:hypothetical protein